MSNAITTVHTQQGVILRSEHDEIVNEFSKPALARRTQDIYTSFGLKFDNWRKCNSYPTTIPVDPRVAIAWLTDLAKDGLAPGTIGIALAAIKYAHTQLGLEFDGGAAVANAMRHIRRGNTEPQDQAAPLTHKLLSEILRRPTRNLLDVRDNALLSLAYVFALRRDELATMDYMQLGGGKSTLVVEGNAMTLIFHVSKTAQEGGEFVAVPTDANPRASGAILRWVREAGIEPGTSLLRRVAPHARRVTDGPIRGDLVGRVIRSRVREHYLSLGFSKEEAIKKAEPFSGHSGRVGFVVSATEAGVSPEDIGKVTRHRPGSAMVRRYGAKSDQIRTSPHKTEGVGL
jgi:hypothetical protein